MKNMRSGVTVRFLSFISFALLALLLLAPLILGATLVRLALVMPRPAAPYGAVGYLLVDCPPFSNVIATGKATVRLDNLIGRTVDRLILQLGGGALTKAMLTNIRLLANEKVIWEDTGSRADTRNQYRGIAASAAFLVLDFNEIRARTIMDQHAGAIDTIGAGISLLSLEVDITGATTPTLAAQAMVTPSPQSRDQKYNDAIAKVVNKTFSPAASGEFIFDLSFQRHPDSYIKRVHLFGTTITSTRVKRNSLEIYKATETQADFIQGEYQRTVQANHGVIDFIVDGNVRAALPLRNVGSLEWYVTVSGAGNVTAVTELLDPLSNN